MNKVINFLYSFFAVVVTGFVSAYFVDNGRETFYGGLNMPPMTPPDRIFPLVWSILYALMIISYYIILSSKETISIQNASLLFLGQLFLQMLWSYLFFGTGYFLYGAIVIILLVWTTWAMIKQFKVISPTAGNLQYPYLLWLLFATYLNIGVVYLNGNMLNM